MSDYTITTKNRVLMERPEPNYYAKIPKMAQLELDPYELALYTNYKQTASDSENGAAWKSNETLAQECHMSARKVSQVRQSLVKKGYIHCEYETDEKGAAYSTAIVTIIDIWQENNSRFSKGDTLAQDAKGVAPHASPPLHDIPGGVAPHATKEESVNKNQENKKESAPVAQTVLPVGNKQTEAKPYYDAIAEILDVHGGQNVDMQKMLEGTSKKKGYSEYNMSPPVSLEEFRRWGVLAKAEYKDYMIKAPAKVNGSITKMRQRRNQAAKPVSIPVSVTPVVQNLATDGVVQFNRAGGTHGH